MMKNPAQVHFLTILKDAVSNPTKAYFFNSWNCNSPEDCQKYAIEQLKKKFNYSDSRINKLMNA
jgi:hypothetical protein